MLPALGAPPPEIVYDDAIYMATPTDPAGLLRKLPTGAARRRRYWSSVTIPGLEELSELLVGGGNDGRAGADGGEVSDRRPRRLYLRRDAWADIALGAGTLAHFITPARLT